MYIYLELNAVLIYAVAIYTVLILLNAKRVFYMGLLDSMSLVSSSGVTPMICTIIGDAGCAKTSLGALFPKPLFIRLEDGTKSLKNKDAVMQTPVLNVSADVLSWLSEIYHTDSPVRSIIFDSVTKLNSIIEDEVLASDTKNAKSINTAMGGYGAGHNAVAAIHRAIKQWCDIIARDKGINIVFIAHSKIETLDSPDLDAYSRYGLKMNKASYSAYIDDVDMVAQLKLSTFVMKGKSELDKSKAKTTGGITITTQALPSSPTKNRYGITADINFKEGVFPFQSIIDTGHYIENYSPTSNEQVNELTSNEQVDTSTGEITNDVQK